MITRRSSCLILVAAVAACDTAQPSPDLAALPATAPAPQATPVTPARVALGRVLFWDPILSGGKDVACATCHHPDYGYSDGRTTSAGAGWVGLGPARHPGSASAFPALARNAPTVVNAAWNGYVDAQQGLPDPLTAPMFWDGRERSLETQATGPIQTAAEMRGNAYSQDEAHTVVASRLEGIAEYQTLFEAAWGAGPITEEHLTASIASFERTLVSPNSSFDRYLAGDPTALTPVQQRGLADFHRAGCVGCHSGPMLSDYGFHNLGVEKGSDVGDGTGRFRTPSLRNVTRTAPYFHNGSAATLADVLQVYQHIHRPDSGADRTDPRLNDVKVGAGDADAIIEFLASVSDGTVDTSVPDRVPSGLPVGGLIH